MRLLLVLLLLVPLAGCFDLFGGGCFTEGGEARWIEPGIYDAIQQIELDEETTRSHLSQPAGRLFDHPDLVEAWGSAPYLVLVRFHTEEVQPALSLDLRDGIPSLNAVSLHGDDETVATWARQLLRLLLQEEQDPDPVVARLLANSHDRGRGGARFYQADVTEPLALVERFNQSKPAGHPEWALVDRVAWAGPKELSWEFSIRAVELHRLGEPPVFANQADWVQASLEEGETDGETARAAAARTLTSYGLPSPGFRDMQIETQTVCT